jgi:hypothetical protein
MSTATGYPCYAVQKLLERLEAKGCVHQERGGAAQVFRPAIDRDELLGRWLRVVAEKLCHGSFTPLLTYLVQGKGLNTRERQALRARRRTRPQRQEGLGIHCGIFPRWPLYPVWRSRWHDAVVEPIEIRQPG